MATAVAHRSKGGLSVSDLLSLAETRKQQIQEQANAQIAGIDAAAREFLAKIGVEDVQSANPTNGKAHKVGVKVGKGAHTTKTGRVRNETNIADALVRMFVKRQNQPMPISAILDAVQKDGYTTQSPNFRGIVNRALVNKKDSRFHRVDRGQYNLTPKAYSEGQKSA